MSASIAERVKAPLEDAAAQLDALVEEYERAREAERQAVIEIERLRTVIWTGGAMLRAERSVLGVPVDVDGIEAAQIKNAARTVVDRHRARPCSDNGKDCSICALAKILDRGAQ